VAPPQTPLGELTALPQTPSWIWEPLCGRGRGWAGEEEGKGEGKGREREVEGREREGLKLLLNQGPSQPCYATDSDRVTLDWNEFMDGYNTSHTEVME